MSRKEHFIRLLLACGSTVIATSAFAQQVPNSSSDLVPQSSAGLEEIVITARRSAERLIDVPVAVTALSAQTIERAHVSDMTQIAQLTPNLIVAPATAGTGGSIAIRGIATSFLDPGVEQSVGINVDGVPLGRAHYLSAAQFDLAQVEVLKGPQALFFGKNSPAGVVSITSAAPTGDLSAMLRGGYEFEAKEKFVEGYVSGPITESLRFRVAARYSKLDGWIKNRVPPTPSVSYPGFTIPGPLFNTAPDTRQIAGRLTLKWKPTTDFSATLKVTGSKMDGGSTDSSEAYCLPGSADAIRGTLATFQPGLGSYVIDPHSDCNLDRRSSSGTHPAELLANWPFASRKGGKGYGKLKTWLASLNVVYQLGPLTLTSITGYTRLQTANYFNAARDFENIVAATPSERDHNFSEEIRLQSAYDGPLNFTVGAFFEDAHRRNGYQTLLGFVGFDASNGNSVYTFRDHYINDGKTYSAFGQLKWTIVDQLELSGGVRYTHETKDSFFMEDYVNPLGAAFGLAPVGDTLRVKNAFSDWSPELALRYKPSNDVMVYVAYKTGYKSGGISNPATLGASNIANPSQLAFSPEKSNGFEAGIKAELFNRTVRLDATAYRYDFTNLQLTSIQGTSYFIRNAGKARTTGVEGSVAWQASRALNLHADAAYNDAKFISYQGAQCYARIAGTAACSSAGFYDRSGQQLGRAPKGVISGGFTYEAPVGSNMKFGLGGDFKHTSKYFIHENGDPDLFQKSFWRLDANARIATRDDKWELSLIGRNLTNQYIKVVGLDRTFGVAGTYTVYSLRPREIVLQGTVKC